MTTTAQTCPTRIIRRIQPTVPPTGVCIPRIRRIEVILGIVDANRRALGKRDTAWRDFDKVDEHMLPDGGERLVYNPDGSIIVEPGVHDVIEQSGFRIFIGTHPAFNR